jgi:hypothetical protein
VREYSADTVNDDARRSPNVAAATVSGRATTRLEPGLAGKN